MFSIKEGNDYFVYMHVFPNDKVYIGITSQNPQEKRWLDSGVGYKPQPRMWRAIQKYGFENVEHIIIARHVNIETAKNMEIDLIALYDSTNRKHGYNASPGGWIMGDEQRKKLSESCKGRIITEEVKKKLSESLKGRKPSQKAIDHIKEYNRTRDYSKMVQPNEMPILQFDVETARFVREYKSINRAAHEYGLDPRNIKACVDEKVGHYNGCLWILKEKYSADYVLRRLYEAQNPQMFCPIMVYSIKEPNNIEYYKFVNDMCRIKGFEQRKVSYRMKRNDVYKGEYVISRISIPDYIEATGKPFFDRKEVLNKGSDTST